MKKFFLLFAATTVMIACTGNKQATTNENDEESQEEVLMDEQLESEMKANLDSLVNLWANLKPSPVLTTTADGKITLTEDEKLVKPTYLFYPDSLEGKLETLSSKYRAVTALTIDREVAKLYGMQDVFTPAITKISAQINDPALKYLYDNSDKMDYADLIKEAYKIEAENGRETRFWEVAATSVIEQTYILCKNKDKFLANFTDDDVDNFTNRVALLVDSYETISQHNKKFYNLYNVVQPLDRLNATTVAELSDQLTTLEGDIEKMRNELFL